MITGQTVEVKGNVYAGTRDYVAVSGAKITAPVFESRGNFYSIDILRKTGMKEEDLLAWLVARKAKRIESMRKSYQEASK
jgi:hypothetical protein